MDLQFTPTRVPSNYQQIKMIISSLSVRLSVCPSIRPSLHPSVHLSDFLSEVETMDLQFTPSPVNIDTTSHYCQTFKLPTDKDYHDHSLS